MGWLACCGVAIAACGREPGRGPAGLGSSRADAKAIEAAVVRYVDATNRGDVAALAALYTEDAMLLPPDHGPIEGRRAIVNFWQQGTDHNLEIVTLRIDVHGDLGYLVGRYTLPATAQEPADSGKYLLCLRRQRDGTWKVTADIWNSSIEADSDDSEPTPGPGEPSDEENQPPRWQLS
jgi:uncharacterized protein (TIGR02246 family)